MTKKSPVSDIQNIFLDAEQLDNDDLTLEQNYNNNFQTSLVNNQIGQGVIPEVLTQNLLFDSLLVNGLLDGKPINTQSQPADSNFGNQLEVELTDSKVAGKRTVKVAVIGLDFQGNLQYDTFTFKLNEKQVTKKHYTNILTILFNDLLGPDVKSFNLGGRVVIREANPLSLSRDPIMVAQDKEPNLFWRDFFVTSASNLGALLTSALPLYNIDNLNIKTSFKEYKILAKNDVSSQVGEKFLANTNNIQKVTLLLGVQNTTAGSETDLAWHGDLVVSIYPLQSVVECPTDIVPNLAIDFSPSNIPLAQVSVNYNTLQDLGVTLDGNAQPVDFVFSNTLIAKGNSVTVGNYYAITVKRSGSADKCDILLASGTDQVDNCRTTIFTGSVWVDLPEDDLWFKVWTDATKISDGQAFETGHGIVVPKTMPNKTTNAEEDFCLDGIQFNGNDLFTGVISAKLEKSGQIQDQRTGRPVFSRQQFIPEVELLNQLDLNNLGTSEPFRVGLVTDKNKKSFDSGSATVSAKIHAWTFVNNQLVIKLIDDVTDPKYDADVNLLASNLVNGDFTNAKIFPVSSHNSIFYRVANAELISMIYGDINGDGIIDQSDFSAYYDLLGADLTSSPPEDSVITTDNVHTTFTNGYVTYVNPFIHDTGINFQIVNPITTAVVTSGTDGVLTADPNNFSLATFSSVSTDFSTITGVGNYNLVITLSAELSNEGGFKILGIDGYSNNFIDISKLYYTSDTLMQIMRADVNCDFKVTTSDGYYIQRYLNKDIPFPAVTEPGLRIGTKFNVLRLTIDPFAYKDVSNTLIERTDDFSATATNRSTSLHTVQDIFLNDGYFASHNFTTAITFSFQKQFSWEDYLIAVNPNSRLVPTVFTYETGLVKNSCNLDGITYTVFPTAPDFDPGKIDLFVPNNIIIGDGDLIKEDGYFYKVDFEVGTVVLEIPDGFVGTEKVINIFDDFVSDYSDTGVTRLGFKAMKFADCSTVKSDALLKNQVRLSVSVQSFSPNITGSPTLVDGKIGVSIDYSTGLLTLNFTNLYQDATLPTLNTKIQVSVFLKKGGFNNLPMFIESAQVQNMLGLTEIFTPSENPNTFTFNKFEQVGGFQSWLLTDGYGKQFERKDKIKIRTVGAGTSNAFTPILLTDNALTSIEITVMAKQPSTGNCAKWILHKNYVRNGGGSPTALTGAPADPAADKNGTTTSWLPAIALSTNSWVVQLTGAGGTTIDWTIDIDSKILS